MLETCDVCGGKGKTYEIPPKRCHDCNGKGVIEVEELQVIESITFTGDIPAEARELQDKVQAGEYSFKESPKPWYKRLFK